MENTNENRHLPKQPDPEEQVADAPVLEESLADLPDSDELDLEKILAEDWDAIAAGETDSEAKDAPEDIPATDIPRETVIFSAVTPEVPMEESELIEDDAEFENRKIRPKRKKGAGLLGIPHILATVIWLALIVAIGVSMGRMLWVCCSDIMAFGKGNYEVTITITKEDTIDSISQKLGQANLVRYPGLFKEFATLTGKDERISAGTFTLSTRLDYNAMINAMAAHGATREVVSIMFPEGATCAQIFKLLADKNVCTVEELEDYAANGELSDYWFLEGVSRGSKYCLEGYLAPDTYNFYTNDSPRRVLEKFLNEFDDRFTDIMKDNFVAMQKLYVDTMRRYSPQDSTLSGLMLTMSMTGSDGLPMFVSFDLGGTSGVFLKWDAMMGAYVSVGATAQSDGETVVWSDQVPIEGAKNPMISIEVTDTETQEPLCSAQLMLTVDGDGYRVSEGSLAAKNI